MAITDNEFYHLFESNYKKLTTTGKAPWMREGLVEREIAHNPKSGVVFKGVNSLMLEMSAAIHGFTESRWLSETELEVLGFHPKHREIPTPIAYQNKFIHPTDVHPSTGLPFDEKHSKEKYYHMYNIQQLREYEQLRGHSLSFNREITDEKIRTAVTNAKTNNFPQISERIFQNAAQHIPEKGSVLSASLAQFRLAQEFNVQFKPSISNDVLKKIVNEVKPETILRTLYKTEIEKDRMISKDMNLESGFTRTVSRMNEKSKSMER